MNQITLVTVSDKLDVAVKALKKYINKLVEEDIKCDKGLMIELLSEAQQEIYKLQEEL
jgi:hypothetical protein